MAATIVLIHWNVEEPELLASAFKDAQVVYYDLGLTIDDAISRMDASAVTHVALVFHPAEDRVVPFFSGSTATPGTYSHFSDELVSFLRNVSSGRHVTVDMLACTLADEEFAQSARDVERDLGVTIRYSLDETGNATNWVLESHGADVREHYFDADRLSRWNYVLSAIVNYPSSAYTYGPAYRLVFGADGVFSHRERIHHHFDADGNALFKKYDDDMRNVRNVSSDAIFWPSGGLANPVARNVVAVHNTANSFAALLEDGTVHSWGADADSAVMPHDFTRFTAVKPQLTDVVAIYGNHRAFAALRSNGTVVTWGHNNSGGNSPALTNIKEVYNNFLAFAALRNDGTVVTWGNSLWGANSSAVSSLLTNVITISATSSAFAAVKSDGTIVVWGNTQYGGDDGGGFNTTRLTSASHPTTPNLHLKASAVYSNFGAFALVTDDQRVRSWGDVRFGGNGTAGDGYTRLVNHDFYTAAVRDSKTVVSVHASHNAFATVHSRENAHATAVLTNYPHIKEGMVSSWGSTGGGGSLPSTFTQLSPLHGIDKVVSIDGGFVATRPDRTIFMWGNNAFSAQSYISTYTSSVRAVYPTQNSFAILHNADAPLAEQAFVNAFNISTSQVLSDTTIVASMHDRIRRFTQFTDVQAVFTAANAHHCYVGLKTDGTVVSVGSLNTSTVAGLLTGVRDVYAGENHFVALVARPAPPAVQNVAVAASPTSAQVSFSSYTDFDADDVVLTGGLAGADVVASAVYRTGFLLQNLTRNTQFAGSFALRQGSAQTPFVPISFSTPFESVSGIATLPDVFGARVTYDEYLDFPARSIVFTGTLAGATIQPLDDAPAGDFSRGFVVSGMADGVEHSGTFAVVSSDGLLASPAASISFATGDAPQVTGVTVVTNTTSVVVTFDEYTSLSASDIILTGTFVGARVVPLQNRPDFSAGFVITGLPESSFNSGAFTLRRGNSQVVSVPISFTTAASSASSFLRMALGSAVSRRDGTTFVAGTLPIVLNKLRLSAVDPPAAHAALQSWLDDAVEISGATAQQPHVVRPAEGETVAVYTTEDELYVHDITVDLASMSTASSETTRYVFESVLYSLQVVFFGGSGGAEITNLGQVLSGGQTFSADQVRYSSAPDDGNGNVTVYAGIVSQGAGRQDIVAPRVPAGQSVYETTVALSAASVNSAVGALRFSYDAASRSVDITETATSAAKAALSDSLFDTSRYGNSERRSLAENCLLAMTDQLANDIPDEFRSGEEAMVRLGLTVQGIDALLRGSTAAVVGPGNLMHALADNVLRTAWEGNQTYDTYGSSLVRNIVLSVCTARPSRLQGGTLAFTPGDEIVFYVTFSGMVRTGRIGALERFGMSSTEIETATADLDGASWLKLVCRIVR